jgi:putative phosphoribosyl transferase
VLFRDRYQAGRELAAQLMRYAGQDVIVLGLPRGGVPVAFEVAQSLGTPLDVFLVRKLGVPGHEELAMGAIASGGVRVLNDRVVQMLELSDEVIERVTAEERLELDRRDREYRGNQPPLHVRGRTVILVDDGLATGSTMRAAVAAVRRLRPARIVVAVPVGAASTCRKLEDAADETICCQEPEPFYAVGRWYEDFSQTTDDEVRSLLEQANSPRPQDGKS